jgi:hypothetical protein
MASELDDLASAAEPLEASLRELEGLADSFGRAMTTAFRQAVVDGKKLEDVLRSLALSLAGRALSAALAPIGHGIGGAIGDFFGAAGGPGLAAGAASRGGGGAGFSDARGPATRAGAAINVTFNVTSPDAQSFRRAEVELTAMLARTVARGRRGM